MRWPWQRNFVAPTEEERSRKLVIIRRAMPIEWNEADIAYTRTFVRSETGRKFLEIYKDTMIENILPESPGAAIDSRAISWIVQGKSYLFEILAKCCKWDPVRLMACIVPDESADRPETVAEAAESAEDVTMQMPHSSDAGEMVLMQTGEE